MNLEKYRSLVNKNNNTMKSTDLQQFVYETTGKFKALGDFHYKVRGVLQAHIANGKMPSTLRSNNQVEHYSMNEVQCNMIMASPVLVLN